MQRNLTVAGSEVGSFDNVTLFDAQGQPVLQQNKSTVSDLKINTAVLPQGFYLIVVEKEGRVIQREKVLVLP